MWLEWGLVGLDSGWAWPGVWLRREFEADRAWVRMGAWELRLEIRRQDWLRAVYPWVDGLPSLCCETYNGGTVRAGPHSPTFSQGGSVLTAQFSMQKSPGSAFLQPPSVHPRPLHLPSPLPPRAPIPVPGWGSHKCCQTINVALRNFKMFLPPKRHVILYRPASLGSVSDIKINSINIRLPG